MFIIYAIVNILDKHAVARQQLGLGGFSGLSGKLQFSKETLRFMEGIKISNTFTRLC